MKWLFCNLASLVSLLMFMAVLYFWGRSSESEDYLSYCTPTRELSLISTAGHLIIYDEAVIPPFRWQPGPTIEYVTIPSLGTIESYSVKNQSRKRTLLGFMEVSGTTPRYTATAWLIPYWSLAILTSVLPILWCRRRFRKGPCSNPWLCETCGYDLRGTAERCPECGTMRK